jgi:hypothetical protein
MVSENIDALKHHPSKGARLSYKLRNANVYISPQGFHFTDYLDPATPCKFKQVQKPSEYFGKASIVERR